MPGLSKIYHEGVEIMYADFRGCTNDQEMLVILKEGQKIVIEEQKEYLQLSDFRDAYLTSSFMKLAKEVAKGTPQIAKKRAILGINSPAKKMLLMGYNLLIKRNGSPRPFDDEDAAKAWLIS